MPRRSPRRSHFDDGRGDPIIGWNTDDGSVCRNCAQNNVEYADVNINKSEPIRLSDVGENANMFPDGFTCNGCGDTLGAWDHKSDDQ